MLLLVATVLSAVIPFTVSAEETAAVDTTETGTSGSDGLYNGRTLEEILDLIGATSYDRYTATNSDKKTGTENITLTADDIVKEGDPDFIDSEDGSKRTDAEYVIKTDENAEMFAGISDDEDGNNASGTVVYTPSSGKITYRLKVTSAGMYSIDLRYFPISEFNGKEVGTKTTIERMFMIDGALPFSECRYIYIPRCWKYVGTDGETPLYREGEPKESDYETPEAYEKAYDEWLATGAAGNYIWDKDIQNNDIRPDRVEDPEWRTYFLRDWLGYTVEPFQFYLSEGTHYLTFEATREPLVLGEILVYGYNSESVYEQKLANWENRYDKITGNVTYLIEAESPVKVSDQVLFPGTDRTSCLNSPSDPADLLYNISNSSVVGQYMKYNVYVSEEGLYNIMVRFRQNTMAGMFTSRRIRINGEIPFKEASYLRFNYDTRFQNQLLGYENEDGDWTPYYFHFKEGWNTIELEVVLGDMSEYIYRIADVIDILTDAYEEILKITGTNPDAYRDYGFSRLIPNTVADLARCALELKEIYETLIELTGDTGQHICTLDTIQQHISKMARDEYEIANGFITFKNYVTSLSNWLYTSLSQPLKLDYLCVQTEDAKVPKSSANFFVAAGYEIRSFFASFSKDYNVIGFADDGEDSVQPDGIINMWNTTSREDALILRTMIDSSFTPETNIAVNIKYVAQGLQESVLAGVGPDVAQMASGTAVSWGLRNAVADLSRVYKEGDDIPEGKKVGDEVYEGFSELAPKDENGKFVEAAYDEKTKKFNTSFSSAAMDAVSLEGETYSIPTTMNFEMVFYRDDIFAQYGFEIPRTWQELSDVLPALVNQHMTMGMQTSLEGYQMLLYQMGSTMYTEDYTQFNSDVTSVTAFDTLCNLFNSYSLPVSYDLTRFRTGEIPIVVANWTTYNTFMGYYELRGLWSMKSLIGWGTYDDEGNLLSVNRSSILNMTGIVIPRGCKDEQSVWKYIKWYTGDEAQTRLARQNLATSSNTTAKYSTANLNALISQAWTDEEREAMLDQIPHLKGICYNPGDYNISRYIKFAFLAVYNNNANAVDSLHNYVVDINKELTRKRKEYHLSYAGQDDEG